MTNTELEKMAERMRRRALEMAVTAGEAGIASHLGGSFSAMEIFAVMYGNVLRYDLQDIESEERDRLFVSKAHCTLAEYTAMSEVGIIDDGELNTYMTDGSPLMGYPQDISRGLEYSGGSLGMAFSFANGVALGLKSKGKENRVYVLLGDGECEEGLHWETFMCAAHYHLDNLIVVIDRNYLQLDGGTEEIMSMGNLAERLNAFGWQTTCVNGHDVAELSEAFKIPHEGKPYAIIAETVKGKGISFLENKKECHQYLLRRKEYEQILKEWDEENCNVGV